MPEALTQWKFLGFAHDRQLRSGLLQDSAVTAKDLMVQPNPPRFLREGDVLEFTVKVSNQSAARQTGNVRLTLVDARTGNAADALLGDVDSADVESWPLEPGRTDVVRVMNLHKAKGLGFPVVLLLLRDTRMAIPSMLLDRSGAAPRLLHARSDFEDRVEEVRTAREARRRMDMADELNRLYVALTRAEDELYVICVHRGERGVPTRFIPPEPGERGRPEEVETIPGPAPMLAP